MRGTGTTSQQLQSAPPNSIFIYCTPHVTYPQNLCKFLGRSDIIIKGIDYLDNEKRLDSLIGRRYSAVVVDHAVESTPARHRALAKLMTLCGERHLTQIDLHRSIANHLEIAAKVAP